MTAFYAFIAIGLVEASLGVLLPSILQAFQLTTVTVTLLFLSQISGYLVADLGRSVISHTLGLGRMMLLAAGLLTTATLQLAHFGEQNRGGLSSAAVYVTIA